MLSTALPFGDRMVLQRQKNIHVWGTGEPGRTVTAELGSGLEAASVVTTDGTWSVTLAPQEAARGLLLIISDGTDKIHFNDVAVGEVWVAGGQSNMEYFLAFDEDRQRVLDGPTNPDLRFFDVPRGSYEGELDERDFSRFGFWRLSTRQDLPYFSAAAYFFAADLQRSLGVPVGVVGCNWGGTPACSWLSAEYLQNNEGRVWLEEHQLRLLHLDPASSLRPDPHQDMSDPLSDPMRSRVMNPGLSRREQLAMLRGAQIGSAPVIGPMHPWRPTGLHETMLKRVAPYAVRGVLWYQGESDSAHPEVYATVFGSVIRCWRDLWSDPLPFLFVQLAPFGEWLGSTGEAFPELRRQQEVVADTVPLTWMASSSYAGMRWDIHPKRKKLIGQRLALLARKHVYGDNVLADPPRFASAELTKNAIVLRLQNADGLRVKRGRVPIEVSSPSGERLEPTDITVEGDRVVLKGSFPMGSIVHFAWTGYYHVNVVNAVGNPATPFRVQV